jgi:cytidine deaminase
MSKGAECKRLYAILQLRISGQNEWLGSEPTLHPCGRCFEFVVEFIKGTSKMEEQQHPMQIYVRRSSNAYVYTYLYM